MSDEILRTGDAPASLDDAAILSMPPSPSSSLSVASPYLSVPSVSSVSSEVKRHAFPRRFALLALGTALLTVAGDAVDVLPNVPNGGYLGPVAAFATATGLVCLLAAIVSPRAPAWLARRYAKLRLAVLASAYALAVDALIIFFLAVIAATIVPTSSAYFNDVISFTHVNAEVALAGGNPYTDDALFVATLRRFPKGLATPMRRGAFGTGYTYPDTDTIRAIERKYVADPTTYAASFDPATLHSYPALSFLLYVPLLAVGLRNILLLHVLLFVAGVFVLARLAPPGIRRWSALVAFASVPLLGHSLLIDSEIVCVAFLLSAWHVRERGWLGGLLLGLACAFKQYCWLFAPFFLLDVYQREGWRGTLRYSSIAATAFLLPNLPYLLMDPSAWLHSVLLPATDPLFPMGMGLEAISAGHILPFAPPLVYTAVELLAYGVALWGQWRWRDRLGDGVLLLALLPLFFAFRSPANYFAIAPWLALYAVNMRYWSTGAVRVVRVDNRDGAVAVQIKGAGDVIHGQSRRRRL
ncbi:MAG TPA: glycosyltransferase 87 family protein [Ktedonobacterales bacterium]|nr:glycosyltransferase 87 family protein [Ktedonobacterales bacterium]